MERVKMLFAPDLFSIDEGGSLFANRCNDCGKIFFPKRDHCLNCHSDDMEDFLLKGKGKLYTYTIVQMPAHKYSPPFALGWMEFPEGIRVMGQLKNWENKDLKIGMTVKLVTDVLWKEDENDIIGYKFELE